MLRKTRMLNIKNVKYTTHHAVSLKAIAKGIIILKNTTIAPDCCLQIYETSTWNMNWLRTLAMWVIDNVIIWNDKSMHELRFWF